MASKKAMKCIVLAILIALVAAGGLMAWASPPEETDEVDEAAAASTALPASTPRTRDPRIAMDAELIGTAVVEGGTSFAVFQSASGTRFVREGDEIASGVRLVQVRRNRIDVERDGVHEEIRLGSSEGIRQQIPSGSIRRASGIEARARLREYLKEKGPFARGC